MNLFRPVRFDGYMQFGGSTKPWKVLLMDHAGNVEPYVVKLFSTKNIEQQHAVAKEIYGSLLARHFSLPTPDYALVNFDAEFFQLALEDEQRHILAQKDGGLKFASRLADSMTIVSPVLYKKYLKEYEIASVFAFDTLVYNLDRGGMRNKPNLLVDDENFFLIDHEQIFPFADNVPDFYQNILERFEKDEIGSPYQHHLFYPLLKDFRTKDKVHLFDEFEEYLRNLQLNELQLAINELHELGVSVGHYDRIISYLRHFSKNSHKFCAILRTLIA